MKQFIPGSVYSGFRLLRKEFIEEIGSTVFLFRHAVLGTPALAIKNSDVNKTFCIGFRTIPSDSTGVAHILEHSVLMGSRKYPVKDVFGEINKGGLMTFLNAMTGSDITYYPFATRNRQEYFNIMDVYCDVTLHPLLDRSTFEQEGWHYHKESAADQLRFQGVVLNEMKGAFSDPIRSLFHHMFQGLMPGSTYAHESGGDPAHIPDLTYEQFRDFHARYYHPSNSLLFFYGDAPLEEELAFVENNFLAAYSAPGTTYSVVKGSIPDSPRHIEETYAIQRDDTTSGKTYLAVGSAIATVMEREINLAFQVIANILFNSDASPLKRDILQGGLCKDFGGLFLASSCYTTSMMTYLIGSDPEKRDIFLQVYRDSLGRIINEGLDSDLVLAELNKYEFNLREEMNRAQRGLDLIGRAMTALKHDLDPFAYLQVMDLLQTVREKASGSRYFEQLIADHLLDNPSTVVVTLRPDPEKLGQVQAREQQRLKEYENSLDTGQLDELIQRTKELMARQQQGNDEQTLNLLPHLSIDDLDPEPDFPAVQPERIADTLFLTCEQQTNGISYIDFGLDCSGLDADLLPWLNLFGTIVTEIGTEKRDYIRLAKDINIYTGGLNHSFSTYMQIQDPSGSVRPILWLHLKGLSQYLETAMDIVAEIFSCPDLTNRQRIWEIVQREYAWTEHSVHSNGYSLASSRGFYHLSEAAKYNELVSGVTSYLALKELARNYQEQEEAFLEKLARIHTLLFRRGCLITSVTSGEVDMEKIRSLFPGVSKSLAELPLQPVRPDYPDLPASQGLCTSAEVTYNVLCCHLLDAETQPYNGHFEVVRTWLSREYLWNTVRQIGGAYGCFIQFNQITGNIGFISYRDPEVKRTYQAYTRIARELAALHLSPQELQQLIIGTYGSYIPHMGPAAIGSTARNEFLSGITDRYKQDRLAEILATSGSDLAPFGSAFERLKTTPYRVTIGNEEKILKNKDMFDEIIVL